MTPEQLKRAMAEHKRDERANESARAVLILVSLPFVAVVVLVAWRVLF